ncbi:hypothetical protein ASZ90_013197 [hydrocarbon metagenome]|uniref:Uncharacterized protein n=1 Tax=hydrocarbon metagenome TaxID=938273 RepID=A0A0W8F8C5_9ZZZZ
MSSQLRMSEKLYYQFVRVMNVYRNLPVGQMLIRQHEVPVA